MLQMDKLLYPLIELGLQVGASKKHITQFSKRVGNTLAGLQSSFFVDLLHILWVWWVRSHEFF